MKVPEIVVPLINSGLKLKINPQKNTGFVWGRKGNDRVALSENYLQANSRWKALLVRDPKSEVALFHLAENHLMVDDFDSVRFYLSELMNLSDSSLDDRIFSLHAKMAMLESDNKSALEYWKKSISNGMNNDHSMYKMASMFLSSDDVESARACLNACSDEMAQSEFGQLLLAKCFVHELQWSKAIRILEDSSRFTKRKKLAENLLYHCYMSDFRHDRALSLCESLDASEHPDKHYMLGKTQYKQHRFDDALASFNKAIGVNKHADSNVWLIRTLYAISEHDSAVAKAELVEAIGDVDFVTQGRCWEAAGMISIAEQHYSRAAKDNNDARSWLALVKFHYNYRHWGRAYAAIVEAEKLRVVSHEILEIKQRITKAFNASDTVVPKFRYQLSKFEFDSNEVMVSKLVDRILLRRPVSSWGDSICSSRKKSRISVVINSLGPGGAERQAVNLVNGLVASSSDDVFLECTYLSRKDQDCFYLPQVDDEVTVREYYDRSEVISPYDIPELADYADLIEHIQPASRQQLILHMAKRLIDTKTDVLHGWLDETFINTALVGSMLGINKIVGRWGSMPPGVSRTITEREESNIEYLKYAYRQIARIPGLCYSSNSRSTGDAYADLLGISAASVNIVYNGIDEKKLIGDAACATNMRDELGIPEAALVVGTVFRISEEKRPMLWVDVASLLLKKHPDMHFVVVGTGPLECQLSDYVSKYKLTNVHLVGRQENVGAWFDLFDVLLMTSRVEGVSNSVIEAQFLGCPVVVPNVGGLSEAMEHERTGYLLDDDSVESFASAVRKVVENKNNLNDLGNNARSFARQKFSIPTMVASYRALFFDDEDLIKDIA